MPSRAPGCRSLHFIRAWVLKPVVRYLDRIGCPTEAYMARARISPDLLDDEESAVPTRSAIRFVELASRGEGIQHIGLRAAQSVTPDDLGGLRKLMASSRNLLEYIRSAGRLASSISTGTRYFLRSEGDEVRFCHSSAESEHPLHGHLFTLGVTIETLRAIAQEPWYPSDLVLPCRSVAGLADVTPAFENARALPAATYSSFTFPVRFLSLKPPPLTAPASEVEALDLGSLDAGGFRRSARRLIESLVPDGYADIQTAADAAGTSVRTFQRRLADHGLVFSQLALEARMELAERWLRESDRPIQDIACSLGYNDPANFTRAFRRVNGMSPTAYRGGRWHA